MNNQDYRENGDEQRNPGIITVARRYCVDVGNAPFYDTFFRNLQKVAAVKSIDLSTFQNSLISTIKNVGLENELRNDVFYWMRERNFYENGVSCWMEKEPMEYLRKAQMQWEKRIYKSLNSMCTELGVSLSLFRSASDRNDIVEKWNMLSTYSIDLNQYRPVYAPKDFLEVLLNIKNPNLEKLTRVKDWNDSGLYARRQRRAKLLINYDLKTRCFSTESTSCGMMPLLQMTVEKFVSDKMSGDKRDFSLVSLHVKSFSLLREMYRDLFKHEPLLGACQSSSELHCALEEERILMGLTVLNINRASVTQKYLKRLAPHSLRGKLWAQVLGSEVSSWHKEYFKNLKQLVSQYDMLVDKLIFKDIQLTVCNDDQYFVFEDLLYQVILCLSRDTAVANIFRGNSSNPTIGILEGKLNIIGNAVIYPPNGVIPFHGFSMYAAPLSYIFNDPVQLYFSVRSLYSRYWFRLHEVNSHPQGLLSLCILFQRLLEFNEPQLHHHFVSIGVQPIKIVFKWLMRCFSGHLPPEQLLYLWDLILGYDSLEIISLLAIAILSFRKDSLLQVDTQQNIEAILADLSSIHVIPLLQFVLQSE